MITVRLKKRLGTRDVEILASWVLALFDSVNEAQTKEEARVLLPRRVGEAAAHIHAMLTEEVET